MFCSTIHFQICFSTLNVSKTNASDSFFNVVFFNRECFRRSFSSTAIHRGIGIGIGRFGVEKATFDFFKKIRGVPAKKCSGPENRDASILVGRHIANAMIFRPFSIVFEHRDRSRHRHRSIRRRKNDVRFLYRNVRRASKKLFGPRKPRCVDFIRQTYGKRYDFFDRFEYRDRSRGRGCQMGWAGWGWLADSL